MNDLTRSETVAHSANAQTTTYTPSSDESRYAFAYQQCCDSRFMANGGRYLRDAELHSASACRSLY